ncbi:MAG: leucyl aminopeptidase [Tissierellia bacterium]|nr:leucyl aminopeptidase [Tissierellia bacterium]
MKFNLGKAGDVEIIQVFKDTEELEKANELYSYLKEKELFKGNLGEVYSNIYYKGDKFILLGLGEKDKLNANSLRTAYFKVGKELMKFKETSVNISVCNLQGMEYKDTISAIVEGLLQSEYSFEKYLSEKKTKPTLENVYLDIDGEEKLAENIIEETVNLVDGIFFARDLVNEPAMYMTPQALSEAAKSELEPLGIKVDIFNKNEIEELNMEAFLAVAEGSTNEPKLIVMHYNGDPDSKEKLALVGKGLLYDSGGYSLKPANSMITMHSDMAGSASVIATIKALAKNNVKRNVVGVVAACENMISGGAYKPGDIIGSMSGKTIEVLNTDAEGRLTLADALWYAATEVKADKIIDIATLTGACVVALGNINTGAITNNEELMNDVREASNLAGEPVWELPNNKEYKELIKGKFADLSNTGGRGAGTITAGLFLEEFVDNTPWVHLDIAGTSYLEKEASYLPKGATGVPVKTLYYLAKEY